MDSKRWSLISILAAAFGLSGTVMAGEPPPLLEAGWLASEGQLEALSTEPNVPREKVHAAARASDLSARFSSEASLRDELLTGEFLFRSPLLLGGQAAKAGLSCHSCHVNGRGNPNFEFAAISDAPGTADTTHSFFSKTLGNRTFDPVPIPDLTQPGKVDHDPSSGDLEAFITRIVVDEFSGSRAVNEAIGPLATYVRALRQTSLSKEADYRPRSLMRDMADLQVTAEEARLRLKAGQWRAASLLVASAQGQMQNVYERLRVDPHEQQRSWLVERSLEAGSLRRALNAQQVSASEEMIQWQAGLKDSPDFAGIEEETLYNPRLLAKALER
ncbi:MAG: hypothetical protein AAF249_00755 [Pseudomonadota bacterium]